MKFEQRMARNAQRSLTTRLGTSLVGLRRPASARVPLLVALLAVVAVPTPARAADPLLSGYAGPGSGEQVLLGGGEVGGGGGGDSSGGAGATADQSLQAAAPGTSSATTGPGTTTDTPSTPKRKNSSSGTSSPASKQKHGGSSTSSGSTSSSSTTAAQPAGAPRVVAYPSRAGEVGGLPFSFGQGVLAILGLALLVLAGVGLRRLRGGPDEPPSTPQVSVR
jgi:hypothetical protein